MLTDDDRKLLVDAQGKKWECPHCGDSDCKIRPTFTDPSELGPLILWAVKQGWWEDFDDIATFKWWPEGEPPRGDYLAWLFQSTEHFASLLAGFLREKGEGSDG